MVNYRVSLLVVALLVLVVYVSIYLPTRRKVDWTVSAEPDYNKVVGGPSNMAASDRTGLKQESSTDSLHQRQNRIRHHVASFCRERSHPATPGMPMFFLVDERRQILMCYLPKVGSTVWQLAFSVLTGKRTLEEFRETQKEKTQAALALGKRSPNPGAFIHKSHWGNLSRLGMYPEDQQAAMLQNYYKFMFVRDPFERLVSTYKDKFIKNFNLFRHLRRIRPLLTSAQYNSNNLSFVEFLSLLEQQMHKNSRPDQHWRKYIDACNPCEVDYNFIGTMEHFVEDSDYILHDIFHSKFNASSLLVPTYGPSDIYSKAHHHNSYASYYTDVPGPLLDNVRQYVEDDCLLFGYDPWRDFNGVL